MIENANKLGAQLAAGALAALPFFGCDPLAALSCTGLVLYLGTGAVAGGLFPDQRAQSRRPSYANKLACRKRARSGAYGVLNHLGWSREFNR